MKLPVLLAVAAAFVAGAAQAQTSYNPQETFAERAPAYPPNAYRSSNGLPGPAYWQNKADYVIHAKLDEQGPKLSGSEVITYTNNSPDQLDVLWLQLDQNRYRPDSRSNHAGDGSRSTAGQSSDGYALESVEILAGKTWQKAGTLTDDTRLRITLPHLLAAKGGKVEVRIAWHFTIPGEWGGRMSWGTVKDGPVYDMAQWYPRMQVYDDVRGWDAPALSRPGILPRIRQFRLFHRRAGRHAGRRFGRADEPERGADARPADPPRQGACERLNRHDPLAR
ncbi:MAG: hypothetical protein WDN06_15520 [Asticcacaulis sp.]